MPTVTGNPLQIPSGREGLARYIRSNDRNAPPYFAGRKRLLSDIEDACMDVWHCHENKLTQGKGLTRVIYGAPGAGKSSVLKYLQYAWQQGTYMTLDAVGGERRGPTPAMLYCDSVDLYYLEEFYENLVVFITQDQTKNLFTKFSETMRVSGGGSAGIVKGGIEHEKTKHHDAVRASMSAMAKVLPHSEWKRPVVIAIDEAQNFEGDRNSPVGRFLRAFHENQHNLPVFVLLAGLSDTKLRVKELGLSRLSKNNVCSLYGLDAAEVEELKAGFCSYFEIDLGRRSTEFDALLQRTDGWAAHLQNCLQSFSEVYLEAQCEIEAVDFARVEQLSQEARMQYYHARRSNAMKASSGILGLLMERLKGREEYRDILSIIQRIADDHAGSRDLGLRMPYGMTAGDYYDDLIHSGALQERDNGKVICPIPSFRQFLIEVGRRDEDGDSADSAGRSLRDAPHRTEPPLYYGLTWDALQRVEAAHEIQPAS